MTLEHPVDRLSEYLDGELDGDERRVVERHLVACDECTRTLAQLRQVVERARTLGNSPPPVDLWPGIAVRVGLEPAAETADTDAETRTIGLDRHRSRARFAERRFSFSIPQLAAAAVILVLLSGAAVWLLRGPVDPASTGPTAAGSRAGPPVTLANFAEPHYDAAVSDLERVLLESRDVLDTATVRVLEQNLRTIDRAIEDARGALAADPANAYLNGHLADNMRRKLQLLRHATALVSAQT